MVGVRADEEIRTLNLLITSEMHFQVVLRRLSLNVCRMEKSRSLVQAYLRCDSNAQLPDLESGWDTEARAKMYS